MSPGAAVRVTSMACGRRLEIHPVTHPPVVPATGRRERMAREAGDSTPALLGSLAGLAGDMRLTRARIDQLNAIRGSVRLAISGEGGFALVAHFGPGPVAEEPDTSISVGPQAFRELRAGGLDAAGRIETLDEDRTQPL